MRLTPQDHRTLQSEAAQFSARNHAHYLAEASECLRLTRDPIAALTLLVKMWNGPHAKRTEQLTALNVVGGWLERRLDRDPGITPERLAMEMGWVRRLAIYAQETAKSSARGQGREPKPRQQGRGYREQQPTRAFGNRLAGITARRHAASSSSSVNEKPGESAEQISSTSSRGRTQRALEPVPLPDRFGVVFASMQAARDAWRTARKRIKKGKAPKRVRLELLPTNKAFGAAAKGLYCTVLDSSGFEALFEAIQQAGGASRPFWVRDVTTQDDGLLAGAVLVEHPSA